MVTGAIIPTFAADTLPAPGGLWDIKPGAWYYDAVKYVSGRGFMQGTGYNLFSPHMKFTRAMTVQVLSKLSGDDLSGYAETDFPDVADGAWFETAVAWAVDKNIVVGIDGKFKPNDYVTREQLARMIHQFADKYGISNMFPAGETTESFADVKKIGSWAKADMEWAVYNGIISGVGQNKLDPKGTATRAQAAQLFYTIHFMKTEGVLPPDTKDFDALTFAESTRTRILCWGDSMSQGYPGELRPIVPATVRSYSSGGDTAEHIAMKQGGLALYVAPFTIPSDTEPVLVPLLDYKYDPVISMADFGGVGLTPAYICGIKGTLYYTDGDMYYFKRETEGEEVKVTRLTRVVTDAMTRQQKDDINIIYSGANNSYKSGDAAELIEIQTSMIEYSGSDKYIIIGFSAFRDRESLLAFNNTLADHYGEHFLDFGSYLITDGFKDAGITPTDEDLQNIADGRMPASFRSDAVHGNDVFDHLLAQQIAQKLLELGYIDSINE